MDNKGIVQVIYYKMPMLKIFISYRRVDSQKITGRIDDHLVNRFGEENVFTDKRIDAGSHWETTIKNKLDDADVLLVVIGGKWIAEFKNPDREKDLVYFEVSQGLNRGDALKIIPLFVNGVNKDLVLNQLPDGLEELANYQGRDIRHDDFSDDIAKLVVAIEPEVKQESSLRQQRWSLTQSQAMIIAALITGIGTVIAGIMPTLLTNTTPTAVPSDTPTWTTIPSGTNTLIAPTVTFTLEPSNTYTPVSPTTILTLNSSETNTPVPPITTNTTIPNSTPIHSNYATILPSASATLEPTRCGATVINTIPNSEICRIYQQPAAVGSNSCISAGASLFIVDDSLNSNGNMWYQIILAEAPDLPQGWINENDITNLTCP